VTTTLNEILTLDGARRALRAWLFDVGREGCTIEEIGRLTGTFHLRDLQRLVCVKGAVGPARPPFVGAESAAFLSRLAKRLGAQAWEARILLRPNYQPQALIWRSLSGAGASKRARPLRFAASRAAGS